MKYNNTIKDSLKNLYINKPEGVTGVSLIKEGDEYVIEYTFESQEKLNQNKEQGRILDNITVDNNNFRVVSNVSNFTETAYEICSSNCYNTYLNSESFPEWNDGPLISIGNRDYVRPIKGGIMISILTKQGTLGFVGIDNENETLVGVTNAHVCTNLPLRASSMTDNLRDNNSDVEILQPSSYVGDLIRYYPFDTESVDNVDAGIFYIPKQHLDEQESFKQYGSSWDEPMDFATTEELDNLWGVNLFKTSRTSGIMGDNNRKLIFVGYGNVNVSGRFGSYYYSATHSDVLRYKLQDSYINYGTENYCYNPTVPGDSGSCVVAEINGVRKIIGLNFAATLGSGSAPYYGIEGVICRIDKIVDALNIRPYKGEPLSEFNDLITTQYFVNYTDGQSNDDVLIVDGEKYYHMGIVGEDCP